MKGLLVKDLRLMKLGLKGIISLIIIAILAMLGDSTMGITMMTMIVFIFGNVAISTIAYDDSDNTFGYIMTLPITRKMYVMEKYLFVTLAQMVGSVVCIVLGSMFNNEIDDLIKLSMMMFGMMIILSSVTIPIYLKYGVEKGKNYIFVIYGSLFILVGAVAKYGSQIIGKSALVRTIINRIVDMGEAFRVTIIVLFLLSIFMISMGISLRLFKNKEF